MPPQLPPGFVPDKPAAAMPQGFEADRVPDFKGTNEKDAQGHAVVGDWIDTLTQWLPTVGGMAGGIVGGIGGTVAGLGVGGAPGAIGGAALGGMAGEAYKQLIRRARGLDTAVPETPSEAATSIAGQGAVQGGAQAVGAALAPGMTALGSRVMQSAVKPGLKTLMKGLGQAELPVVKTLMDEGINVTPGGVSKLQALLNATNKEISTAVQGSSAQVSPLKVAGRLSDTAKTFASQVNPQADLEAISRVGQNFLDHPSIAGAGIPVAQAQALKQGTYAQIGGKYGQVSAATIEAEKAIARGLKEEIAKEVPAVAGLNAREGKLLEALDAVGRRVAFAGNRDPIGFAWVAHNPTTFLAALIDRSPAVKSMLARGMYNSAGAAGKVSPQLIRVAVQALTTEGASEGDSSTDRGGQ